MARLLPAVRPGLTGLHWLDLVGAVPADQLDAITLGERECWRVEAPRDGAAFYRALGALAPLGSVLYLERTTATRIAAYAASRPVPHPVPVALGTIVPLPDRYHLSATPDTCETLACLIAEHHIAVPAHHTHLYHERRLLVEWYDAFGTEPLFVSQRFPEPHVEEFARMAGTRYRWAAHPV